MKVLVIGGSRNIGYFSALRLLDSGATVTFLLRKPQIFDNDENIQKYVKDGKARLVTGDALIKDDVSRAWAEASSGDDGKSVDLLIFTLGARSATFHITKGFLISPANLVTQAILNVFETVPPSHPNIIAISPTGVTTTARKALPWLIRGFVGYFIPQPYRDKRGAEQIYARVAGFSWDTKDNVGPDILAENWTTRVPAEGQYKNIVIIRAALLTNGPSRAEKHPEKQAYRVQDDDVSNAYTVSRKDVAHFLVEKVVKHWDEWAGRRVSIAY
ncbi:hypothetical protein V8B97DRAFT_1207238 [Scleroderma yunnanense]